ncbi:sugar-binding domain-containing protein [Flavobacterium sp.]|uniref:glycoside hydrolase family 2 protein n=1 Tax=Flavobacterium sp. TaxID=239 RepID=UPI00286DD7C2|nr:sugar-binding domain-containing protein [Flavobacterium sp.]
MNLNKLILVFCLFFSIASFAQGTKKLSLDGKWSFKIDPEYEGETLGFEKKDFDTSHWDKMEVPGNWNLHNLYSEYSGDAWYSRTFTVNESQKNQLVRLVFESVFNDSKVWINGKLIGENHLGFMPFQFDISKHINYNQENRITVLVNNMFKKGAMWSWGGIRRPVSLEITAPIRIDYQHITAIPDLKKGTAEVQLKIVASNTTALEKSISYTVYLKKDGKIVAQKKESATIPANTFEYETFSTIQLSKSNVTLWHYDFPVLYESSVVLNEGNQAAQTISNQFGIRKVEVIGTKILLNGESVRAVGFNVLAEDRITGTTLPFEKIKADVDMMKSMGVVMTRLAHVTLPEEYLDYLDEKGIMIFSEVGLWGKDRWVDPDHPMPKEWLQRIIKKEYNHPSIIGWSVGNEIGSPKNNPKTSEYIKGAVEMSKKLDPNRLAVYASNTAQSQVDDAVKYCDLALLNLYGGFSGVDKAWNLHKMPIFVSEFGQQLNSDDPNLGVINIKKMMDDMRNKEYVLGLSLWTLNDYRSKYNAEPPTAATWTTPPSQNRTWGIVTTMGKPKRSFAATQKEYAPVKGISLSDINKEKGTAKVTIIPRAKLDIPANILRGFKVQWSVLDANFSATKSGEKVLKTIYPGDSELSFEIKCNLSKSKGIKIEFVDPQGYIVLDEIYYFAVPDQPKIKHTDVANDGVRFIFDKVPGADEYAVQYQLKDSIYTTKKTINNFVEIEDKKVKQDVNWTYKVIAYNKFGASTPSNEVIVARNELDLPPIIWDAVRNKTNIFIGFEVLPKDDMYEIEYGFKPSEYNRKLAFKNQGVVRLSNIPTETPVYFRMRIRKQTGFTSEWTHEIKVK